MSFTSSEVKSGIFVVVSFALLFILTFHVSDFRTWGETREYKIHFNYAGGLEENSPVHFAGRSVGKVQAVELREGNPAILVTVEIDQKTPVRTDSEAFVDTLGLLGEKFVEITPGQASSPRLAAGGVLRGREGVPLYQLIQQMNDLTAGLIPLTEKTNRILEGHEKDVGEMIENLNATSRNLKEMTEDLKAHPWKLLRKGTGRRFLFF